MDPRDGPFDEVVANANKSIAQGAVVFQKFTCAGCGARLTIEEPNTFVVEGTCDKCPTVTNIKERGCGFSLVQALGGDTAAIIHAATGKVVPRRTDS